MKVLCTLFTLFSFALPSVAMLFEKGPTQSQDSIDQAAQKLAEQFPAVCKVVLAELDDDYNYKKAKSICGVLVSVNKEKKLGYVLSDARIVNGFFEDNCAIGILFGQNGNLSEVPLESMLKCKLVYHYTSHTNPDVPIFCLFSVQLPDDFSIEPLPIYDGQGYLKGGLMDGVMVSYGPFSTGQEPVLDCKRRAGKIKVRFEKSDEEHLLVYKGKNTSQTLLQQLTQPAKDFELSNNQAWPLKGDNGLPLIFKTSRGYQLAGIYWRMIGNFNNTVWSHQWYFIPRDIAWVNDIINDTLDSSTILKEREVSKRMALRPKTTAAC